MKKIIAFVLLFAFGFSSCEKDDICDANTPTTPRLVISFYDINIPSVKKKVTRLKVIGEGQTEGIVFNKTAIDETKYLTSGDSISIPLKPDADTVTYSFILNSGSTDATFINTDAIKFNYTRQNAYVSRACGFKTIFKLNTQAPFERQLPDADGPWMQVIEVKNANIERENETHLKVYF
ncbi:DUF6452 family protein [Flavobacterium hercynium]|uniref:Uncharacterized protein n=1 Tax=Flavobacterium hercynium TaxID=387094 RepID=A0A226HSU3_9FLAO|nr:DUF6452 family protein [Flavobacterium hercynium]OXA97305.1 hypothetical protein B0A66_00245 [Flavobacterium hercynium]SMP18235.1 hypothetical protein SAMN06265346_105219 [Flavobacterium hercynium]